MSTESIILSLTPLLGILLILIERMVNKKGTGVRTIQILTLVIAIPIIALLNLKGTLSDSTMGTLLGAILGYTLSDLSKSFNSNSSDIETDRDLDKKDKDQS